MSDPTSRVFEAMRQYARIATDALLTAGFRLPPASRTPGWQPVAPGRFSFEGLASQPLPPDGLHQAIENQHALAEYQVCIDALHAHPVIAPRLGQLLGSAGGASLVEAGSIPDRPLWALLRNGRFDEEVFREVATRQIEQLSARSAEWVVLAPLPGLVCDDASVELDAGVEIVAMSDEEIAVCLNAQLLSELTMSAGIIDIDRRCAIRLTETWPVCTGDPSEADQRQLTDAWRERSALVESVVHTLRLFKRGSVSVSGTATFSLSSFRGGAVHYGFSPVAHPRSFGRSSYTLSHDEAGDLKTFWRKLRARRITSGSPVEMAMRRFAFAGERARPEDRLLDLMIASEALFTPRTKTEVAYKLRVRAAAFLGARAFDPTAVFSTMKHAYNARGEIAHGVQVKAKRDRPGVDTLVADVTEYVRYVLHDVFATPDGQTFPSDDDAWDQVVLALFLQAVARSSDPAKR